MSLTTTETAVSASPDSSPAPIYRLSGITRQYEKKGQRITPLSGLDLDVATGDFATIQGPTGGGKSTLLQLLGALDRPTSGTITLDGTDLSHLSDAELTRVRKERIGFVFQSFNLLPTLTASENVDTALEGRGISPADRAARVRAALARVGLAERGEHRPMELSGGQQQRVAIARALVAEPHVLLADEPTGNLDESMRDEILGLLEQLNAEGLTIIAVTHDSAVAKRAKRRLRLEHGRIRDITRS
ncbi:ABC transporter ATP-binding protein [Leucobacter japonicus]|uniref:ABC transporter ATP-binding protein n=1 Tax=Leucobacter japonicus TaxID=1461259 RepID=UPI000A7C093F|nr:ABC transporter ATP-binding protein [Leucobacter japonicus]